MRLDFSPAPRASIGVGAAGLVFRPLDAAITVTITLNPFVQSWIGQQLVVVVEPVAPTDIIVILLPAPMPWIGQPLIVVVETVTPTLHLRRWRWFRYRLS